MLTERGGVSWQNELYAVHRKLMVTEPGKAEMRGMNGELVLGVG